MAFIVRIVYLNQTPLFGDEIDVGLQANSLLHSLRDYRGNFLPFYLQSFSESRAPLFIYASIPSVALFGITPFAVRFVPLLFGLLSIYFLYKLVLLLTRNSQLSTYSALVLAFTPWHIHYSRVSFELTLLTTLLLSATYFFYRNKTILATILFALTFYTYNIANILTPLLMLYLIFTTKKQNYSKSFFIFIILLAPIATSLLFGKASNRFGLISIFNDPKTINQIIDNRTDFSSSQNFSEKIFHHKPESYLSVFSKNYLSAISPSFYFGVGDPNPRQQVPQTSLFLLPLAIPFGIGLLNSSPLFLFWFIASPIASALTQGGGAHASRLFLMIVPITYFIAVGLTLLNKHIRFSIFSLTAISLIFFLHNYYVHYPNRNFASWQYGYDQMFSTTIPFNSQVFISNTNFESLPRFAFYQNTPPEALQTMSDQEVTNSYADFSGFNLNTQTHFINDWKSADVLHKISTTGNSGDYFFLLQLKDIPGDMDFTKSPLAGFTTIKTVYYPNNLIMGQVLKKN